MKFLVQLARIIVGVLFIISGLIKLNDPVGFAFKLEEYFSPPVLDIPWLEPYALALALFLVVLEVILGISLLVGFKKKLTLRILLLTILFFTFLTFYSAYYNKVTDCGCFGDALKLTPWESFTKDVILLILILFLFRGKAYIKPIFTRKVTMLILGISVLGSVLFANFVLRHLPWIDFRAYKIGTHIGEGMSVPEDAPKAIFQYAWEFEVDGTRKIITTQGEYPEVEGELIGVETTEIQAGYEPPIHDFTIEKNGLDQTRNMLQQPQLLMVISYDLAKSELEAFQAIKQLADSATNLGYRVIGMSASLESQVQAVQSEYNLNFPFYFTDQTTLKTIIRSNPGVLRLEKGRIVQKVHYNDLDRLELRELSPEEKWNTPLQKTLDSMLIEDQRYRGDGNFDNWGKQMKIDSANIQKVAALMETYGYPGTSLVGEKAGKAAWYVIQHSNQIDTFLSEIQVAAETGELPFRLYAMMLDRSLMGQGLPQRYGTQGQSQFIGSPDEIDFIWPVEDPENINEIRSQAGFDTTMEDYGKALFGDDFQYRHYTLEQINTILNKQN